MIKNVAAATLAGLIFMPISAQGPAGILGSEPPDSKESLSGHAETAERKTKQEAAALKRFDSLPIRFEVNKGQLPAPVRFSTSHAGYTLFLTPNEAVYSLTNTARTVPRAGTEQPTQPTSSVVRMKLLGATSNPKLGGQRRLEGFSNYFIGRDSASWNTGVPHFGRVVYRGVYPGIDLVYRGSPKSNLEYDFVVAPGADPSDIALSFDTSGKLQLTPGGDLLIVTDQGTLRHRQPELYQMVRGTKRKVSGHFLISSSNQVRFRIGGYDRSRRLIIDPELGWSRRLGVGKGDIPVNPVDIRGIDIDQKGFVYVTGTRSGVSFPTKNAAQEVPSTGFLTKLDPSGQIAYSTYIGGAHPGTSATHSELFYRQGGWAIDVDKKGNAFFVGKASKDFPTTPQAFRPVCGENDAFVAQINPELPSRASLVFSTCLLGEAGLPPANRVTPLPGVPAGPAQAVAYRMDLVDEGQVPGIYFLGAICALPPYCGPTTSAGELGLPANGFQTEFQGGETPSQAEDYFVARLNLQGDKLDYFSFLGGSGNDGSRSSPSGAVDADASGRVYVTGVTGGPADFPLQDGARDGDVFAALLDTRIGSSGLVWATMLGGFNPTTNSGDDIVVDSHGSVYVAGTTSIGGLGVPNDPPTSISTYSGGTDAFLARFDMTAQPANPGQNPRYPPAPAYFSYLGGEAAEGFSQYPIAIALVPPPPGILQQKTVLVSGTTASRGEANGCAPPGCKPFPVKNADGLKAGGYAGWKSSGGTDGFVAKIDTSGGTNGLRFSAFLGGGGGDAASGFAIDGKGNVFVGGTTHSTDFPTTIPGEMGNPPAEGFITKLTARPPRVRIIPSTGPKSGGTPVEIFEVDRQSLRGSERVHLHNQFHGQEVAFTPHPTANDRLLVTIPPYNASWSINKVHISVTTFEGSSEPTDLNLFTYLDSPAGVDPLEPILTSVTPPTGGRTGGTPVSIAGARFTGATHVTFGGATIPASSFSGISDSEINLNTPPHDRAETVAVTVTTNKGTSNPGQFTYTEPPPIPPASPKQEPGGLTSNAPLLSSTKPLAVAPPGGGGISGSGLAPSSLPASLPVAQAVGGPASAAIQAPAVSANPMGGLVSQPAPGSVVFAEEGKPEAATRHAMVGRQTQSSDDLLLGVAALMGVFCLFAAVGSAACASRPLREHEYVVSAAAQACY